MTLDALCEAILFAVGRPQTVKRLAELTERKPDEIRKALETLSRRLRDNAGGIMLAWDGKEAELVSHGDAAEIVRAAIKAEVSGELTRPSLEALAVLAYRGPMTRPELEQIRGVQSSLILRNLMLRGLVEMREDTRLGQPLYAVTLDFLKHIGADRVETLPDYEILRGNPVVEQVLDELEAKPIPREGTLPV
jgi:segregation and condensation protein B